MTYMSLSMKSDLWQRPSPKYLLPLSFLRRDRRDLNEGLIRDLCENAYLGNETAVCRILGRYKIFVDTQDVGLSMHLLLEGYWEIWVTEVLASLAKPGMVAVDVGANVGYFSLLLADCVGPNGALHAFEPNPEMASRLRKSLSCNGFDGHAVIHQTGLDDNDGEALLVVPDNEPKNGFVVPAGSAPIPGSRQIAARTRRLDSYPALLRADLIKIDAEGAEERIWQGMRGIFDQGRPLTILLEFNPSRYRDPAAFMALFQREGFQLARIDFVDGSVPISPEAVLESPPSQDQMLVLSR